LAFLDGKAALISINHSWSSGISAIFRNDGIASVGHKYATDTESLSAASGFDSGFVITFRFSQASSGTGSISSSSTGDGACTKARIIFEFDNVQQKAIVMQCGLGFGLAPYRHSSKHLPPARKG